MHSIVEQLRALLGPTGVITDPADMERYTVDWRARYHGAALCVARPGNVAEVSEAMALCHRTGVPVVPQGGNTGLRGGASPVDPGCVVISVERLKAVRQIDLATDAISVDAGCTLESIQKVAEEAGRLFPLAFGAQGSCQIGGNIATNAGGLTVMRYGTVRDLILGIEVVLADGTVMNTMRALRKFSAGYDLKHIFVGSEGTLGIITGAVLKLFPRPRTHTTLWVALPDLDASIRLLTALKSEFHENLTSFEVMSRGQLELVFKHCENTSDPVAEDYPWAALIELASSRQEADLSERAENLLAACLEDGTAVNAVVAANERQSQQLWYLREALSIANVTEGRHVSHDTSVPIAALPRFVEDSTSRVLAEFPDAVPISSGHVGDGNIHVGFMFQRSRFPTPEAYEDVARRINEIIVDVTMSLNGGFCAEHGIGIAYRGALARFADPAELSVMKKIKEAMDPRGLLNPGKVFT